MSDDTELEPEALVTRHSWRHYTTEHPAPEDALLIGEVAETTHGFLLGFKSSIYAQTGIMEYWVVDSVARELVVHREPGENGYCSVTSYRGADAVSPLAAPDVTIAVSDLLPPLE